MLRLKIDLISAEEKAKRSQTWHSFLWARKIYPYGLFSVEYRDLGWLLRKHDQHPVSNLLKTKTTLGCVQAERSALTLRYV